MKKVFVFVCLTFILFLVVGCSPIEYINENSLECASWAKTKIPNEFKLVQYDNDDSRYYFDGGNQTKLELNYTWNDGVIIVVSGIREQPYCVKGKNVGENINYWYCLGGDLLYMSDKIINKDGLVLGSNRFQIWHIVLEPTANKDVFKVVSYDFSACSKVD